MSFLTILFTAFGLSMDAVAVSVSSGMGAGVVSRRHALRMALWFGAFQALMPAAGFILGAVLAGWVEAVDHWIAFGLLTLIGAKMIRESLDPGDDGAERPDPFAPKRLTLLAVATSIDALAVGLSFSLLDISLAPTVIIIGLTTFALCYPAVLLGRTLGALFARRAELVGGLVLIGIGVTILVEHTMGG